MKILSEIGRVNRVASGELENQKTEGVAAC